MSNRKDFSKKIIKILSQKLAVGVKEIEDALHFSPPAKGEWLKAEGVHTKINSPLRPMDTSPSQGRKNAYAITRSIKGLEEAGLIEQVSSGQNEYARLTKEGKKKAMSIKLESEDSLVSTTWDGYWRVILLDLPEARKNERESLRYLLKKAGFICLKNSAWISPYPFEHLFTNIKKDLGLTTEIMILVTKHIDEVTEQTLFELFHFTK